LTGTWKNSISGRGLIIWLSKTTDKWYYDIELHLNQTGNTITGWIKEALYNAPISWSHEPITAWITDGSVNGVNLKFKVGSMQWTGTFLSWSMKGVVQGQGWEGTFDLQRV
jgi:hypothetical protein